MSVTEREADYALIPVPPSERRSPWTMGLLWITMVTGFPTVLAGVQWFKEGISLSQVLLYCAISCFIVLAYSIPAIQLGTHSGFGYATLSRHVFGRWGSRLVAINLIMLFIAIYGLFALLLCDSLNGLFGWHVSLALASACLAMLMAVNNFFGFRGIANFARYVAAPMMIGWVVWTFFKAAGECSPQVFAVPSHVSSMAAFASISGYVVGYAVWGNEPDYWRFGQPKILNSLIPVVVTLLVGNMLFPVTGWLVAQQTGVTDYAQATLLLNKYAFGGTVVISALVLTAYYFACNDSCLYGIVRACEHLKELSHRTWALMFALVGAGSAVLLSLLGVAKGLEDLLWVNAIFMPTPTVIMITEWFLASKIFKSGNLKSFELPASEEIPAIKYPAIIALFAGITVGIITSGVIPGTEKFKTGIFSVQAWLTAVAVYIPLRLYEYRRNARDQQLIRAAAVTESTAESTRTKVAAK